MVYTTCRTSAGDQDITVSGLGDVKAFTIEVCGGTTNDTSASPAAMLSVGASDIVNHNVVHAFWYQDGAVLSPVSTYRSTSPGSSRIVQLFDLSTGVEDEHATFAGTITDGIRLSWPSGAPAAYKMKVTMWAGDDVQASVEEGNIAGGDIGLDFTPSFLFTYGHRGVEDYDEPLTVSFTLGYAINDDRTDPTQFSFNFAYEGGTVTTVCTSELEALVARALTFDGELTGLKAGFGSNSYRLDFADADETQPNLAVLAVYWPHEIDLQVITTPTSTGAFAITEPFGAQAISVIASLCDNVDEVETANMAGTAAAGGWSKDGTHGSISVWYQDGVATSNTGSIADAKLINIKGHNGSVTQDLITSVTSVTGSAVNLSFTETSTTARKWIVLAFQDEPLRVEIPLDTLALVPSAPVPKQRITIPLNTLALVPSAPAMKQRAVLPLNTLALVPSAPTARQRLVLPLNTLVLEALAPGAKQRLVVPLNTLVVEPSAPGLKQRLTFPLSTLALEALSPGLKQRLVAPLNELVLVPSAPSAKQRLNLALSELVSEPLTPGLKQRAQLPFTELVVQPFAPGVPFRIQIPLSELVLRAFAPSLRDDITCIIEADGDATIITPLEGVSDLSSELLGSYDDRSDLTGSPC